MVSIYEKELKILPDELVAIVASYIISDYKIIDFITPNILKYMDIKSRQQLIYLVVDDNGLYIENIKLETIKKLLEIHTKDKTILNKCLLRSIRYDRIDIVKLLIDYFNIDPSFNNSYSLILSLELTKINLEMVKILIKDPRIDVNTEDCCPLFLSIYSENIEVANILINNGATVSKSVLEESINSGLSDFATLFILNYKSDISVEFIYKAVNNNDVDMVKLLIRYGVVPDRMLLGIAKINGFDDIVPILESTIKIK